MPTISRRFPPLAPAVPAIAVAVQGAQLDEVLHLAGEAVRAGADLVEWRLDALAEPIGADLVGEVLTGLRAVVGERAVLATYRSLAEGGAGRLDDAAYLALLLTLVESGADAVDVELSRPGEDATAIAAAARRAGVIVVGSSHDFAATPDDLDAQFAELARRGSDVLKVAATPIDAGDVLRLLTAADSARRTWQRPVVPIAMGPLGAITRIGGSLVRAPFTFGQVAGRASAPGQFEVATLRAVLDALHGTGS